jgi:CheY-like chemotaxis protein
MRDRAELQRWYRDAMRRRAGELDALSERIRAGDRSALDAARSVGMSLRGSGASFGFPHVSEVAAMLEVAPDADVLRRVEGLATELRAFAAGGGGDAAVGERGVSPGSEGGTTHWLVRAAGLSDDGREAEFRTLDPRDGASWTLVARRAGLDLTELAQRVADYFAVEVADFGGRTRGARRLVPEAVVAAEQIVPLREDARSITVATSDPTSLSTELELQRLTGRRPVLVVAPPEAVAAVLAEDVDRTPPGPSAPRSAVRERVPEPRARRADGAILVVDDDPSARVLLRAMLEKRGYGVVEATDGVEALDRFGDGSGVRLVVADLDMPRMDGLELLWALRDHPDGVHVPVIVVTGERDDIVETQLLEEGADDYIRKPIDPRLFLARVDATARRVADATGGGPATPRNA